MKVLKRAGAFTTQCNDIVNQFKDIVTSSLSIEARVCNLVEKEIFVTKETNEMTSKEDDEMTTIEEIYAAISVSIGTVRTVRYTKYQKSYGVT